MHKILEQNGIDNENIDGGALNNLAAGGRDGIVGGVLSECAITATGSVIAVAPGLLILHGVRVKFEELEAIELLSVPVRPTSYQVVAQITLSSNRDVDFQLFVQAPKSLTQNNIYANNTGVYQAELATFTHNPDGSISDLIRTIDVIFGGGEGGGVNIEVGDVTTETLPAGTNAEFDVAVRNPVGTNKTVLDFSAKIPRGASGVDEGAVHFNEEQNLSDSQKVQARNNIGAVSENDTVKSAENVSQSIGGKVLTDIFESNGTTVKNATSATNDSNGTPISLSGIMVGEVKLFAASVDPAETLGGTWEQLTADAYFKIVTTGAGATGGTSSSHTIPLSSMPSHNHNFTELDNTGASGVNDGGRTIQRGYASTNALCSSLYQLSAQGGGQPYYPYYFGVYAWKRIA